MKREREREKERKKGKKEKGGKKPEVRTEGVTRKKTIRSTKGKKKEGKGFFIPSFCLLLHLSHFPPNVCLPLEMFRLFHKL